MGDTSGVKTLSVSYSPPPLKMGILHFSPHLFHSPKQFLLCMLQQQKSSRIIFFFSSPTGSVLHTPHPVRVSALQELENEDVLVLNARAPDHVHFPGRCRHGRPPHGASDARNARHGRVVDVQPLAQRNLKQNQHQIRDAWFLRKKTNLRSFFLSFSVAWNRQSMFLLSRKLAMLQQIRIIYSH